METAWSACAFAVVALADDGVGMLLEDPLPAVLTCITDSRLDS
jgi:hypothetical protein